MFRNDLDLYLIDFLVLNSDHWELGYPYIYLSIGPTIPVLKNLVYPRTHTETLTPI